MNTKITRNGLDKRLRASTKLHSLGEDDLGSDQTNRKTLKKVQPKAKLSDRDELNQEQDLKKFSGLELGRLNRENPP